MRIAQLVFAGLFVAALADKCPSFTPVSPFDIEEYMGAWYEIKRYPAPFEIGASCGFAKYSLEEHDNTQYVAINNTGLYGSSYRSAIGAGIETTPNTGALKIDFSGKSLPAPTKPNYNVLATDYDNYSLVYTCRSALFFKIEFAWILGRNTTLPQSTIDMLEGKLIEIGSNPDQFITPNQQNCPPRDV